MNLHSLIGNLPDIFINSVNQLTDSLTGLERILTTPIPFSWVLYSASANGWWHGLLDILSTSGWSPGFIACYWSAPFNSPIPYRRTNVTRRHSRFKSGIPSDGSRFPPRALLYEASYSGCCILCSYLLIYSTEFYLLWFHCSWRGNRKWVLLSVAHVVYSQARLQILSATIRMTSWALLSKIFSTTF